MTLHRSPPAYSTAARAGSKCSPIIRSRPSRETLLRLIEQAGKDGVGPLRIEEIAPQDWVTLSQGQRGPVAAGRFVVHGSHDRGQVPRRRTTLEIDAGQAFGTAHHASTRGCLLALDDQLKRRRPRRIVDIGTGTGILAIAAAKVLRRTVVATDSDGIAAAIAVDNARNNGVKSQVAVLRASGFLHPRLWRCKANLVLANLLEPTLYDLAPALSRHISSGGSRRSSKASGRDRGPRNRTCRSTKQHSRTCRRLSARVALRTAPGVGWL